MHWYKATDGSPCYEIPYADGRPGKTPTLADARKLGLVPSVTSIIGILDKPGLTNWRIEQAILAALTNPVIHDQMPHQEMLSIVRKDAEAQSQQAMQRGTDIHDAIEKRLGLQPVPEQYKPHTEAVVETLAALAPEQWRIEAHLPGGLAYGGRADLVSDEFLIDFKTKEFGPEDKIQGWPEQEVQLVAYDLGFGGPQRRLVNVFVSSSTPGLVRWIEWPAKSYEAAVRKWQATLACWYAWKGLELNLEEK
jgi:hypothetical protein